MLGVSIFGFCGLILKYGFFFVWVRNCFHSLIKGFEKHLGFEYGIFCVAGSPGLNLVNHGELLSGRRGSIF